MSDADERYQAEIAADCQALVGGGIRVVAVGRQELDAGVRLVATLQLRGRTWDVAADGETAVAAHARLRERVVEDRLGAWFGVLVEA